MTGDTDAQSDSSTDSQNTAQAFLEGLENRPPPKQATDWGLQILAALGLLAVMVLVFGTAGAMGYFYVGSQQDYRESARDRILENHAAWFEECVPLHWAEHDANATRWERFAEPVTTTVEGSFSLENGEVVEVILDVSGGTEFSDCLTDTLGRVRFPRGDDEEDLSFWLRVPYREQKEGVEVPELRISGGDEPK